MAQLYDTLDPVPSGLVDRIQFGITLDALHAEIAELQRSGDLVGVRAEASTDVADRHVHEREPDHDGHHHADRC